MRLAILTISDAGHRGERADTSGDAIAAWAAARGYARRRAARSCPTRPAGSRAMLIAVGRRRRRRPRPHHRRHRAHPARRHPRSHPRRARREAPGIAEALRMAVYPRFPRAALSRGMAGVRGRTLIVNLPGSTGGVRDGLARARDSRRARRGSRARRACRALAGGASDQARSLPAWEAAPSEPRPARDPRPGPGLSAEAVLARRAGRAPAAAGGRRAPPASQPRTREPLPESPTGHG